MLTLQLDSININNKPQRKDIVMKCKCKVCGYHWESRKDKPKACPACKRYDWNREKKQ